MQLNSSSQNITWHPELEDELQNYHSLPPLYVITGAFWSTTRINQRELWLGNRSSTWTSSSLRITLNPGAHWERSRCSSAISYNNNATLFTVYRRRASSAHESPRQRISTSFSRQAAKWTDRQTSASSSEPHWSLLHFTFICLSQKETGRPPAIEWWFTLSVLIVPDWIPFFLFT